MRLFAAPSVLLISLLGTAPKAAASPLDAAAFGEHGQAFALAKTDTLAARDGSHDMDDLPSVSVGAVLPAFSMDREDLYRDGRL